MERLTPYATKKTRLVVARVALLAFLAFLALPSFARASTERCFTKTLVDTTNTATFTFPSEWNTGFTFVVTESGGSFAAALTVANEFDANFVSPILRGSSNATPAAITGSVVYQFDGPWNKVKVAVTTCSGGCTVTYSLCGKGNL